MAVSYPSLMISILNTAPKTLQPSVIRNLSWQRSEQPKSSHADTQLVAMAYIKHN